MVILDDSYAFVAEKELDMCFKEFIEATHIIIGTEDKLGALGFELHEDFIWITFAYTSGTYRNKRELIEIMQWAFEFYTVDRSKPILYTGRKNNFPLISIEVDSKVWQYVPKKYLI